MRRVFLLFISIGLIFSGSQGVLKASLQLKQSQATPSSSHREVAFTIDDLPGVLGKNANPKKALALLQAINKQMLEVLTANKVPAIGFVNESRLYVKGETDERINLLRSWLDAGMMLGNHTFSHPNFNDISLAQFEDEIIKGEAITRRLLDERGASKIYLRFPFNHTGNTKEKKEGLESFLKERAYKIAPFTVEHSDYLFNAAYLKAKQQGDEKLAQQIRATYLDYLDTSFNYFERRAKEILGYEPKQIFLIHVNQINAESLSAIIERLKKRGYSFITLDEALQDKAYQISDDYVGPYGLSWLHRWSMSLGQKLNNREEPDPPKFVLDLANAN
jgi:peptidoglycan/xylan/chitin deacetylase (PgdA/CDA1 family)